MAGAYGPRAAGPGQGARFTFTIPAAGDPVQLVGAVPVRARPAGPDGRPPPVLVVDDDPRMLRFVRDALAQAGYAPLATGDPEELPRIVRSESPCLVLLDLMLPGTDGIELMETLPELADIPVIFISAYGRDETVARALERGARRLPRQALLGDRAHGADPGGASQTGRNRRPSRSAISPSTTRRGGSRWGGRPVRLTATEYELLRLLTLNAGRVSTYESLIRRLWNEPDAGDPDRVRTFIKQLRRKLGDDPARPRWILNERGVGYRVPGPEG